MLDFLTFDGDAVLEVVGEELPADEALAVEGCVTCVVALDDALACEATSRERVRLLLFMNLTPLHILIINL